jgi:hypothetical protein
VSELSIKFLSVNTSAGSNLIELRIILIRVKIDMGTSWHILKVKLSTNIESNLKASTLMADSEF